MVRDTLRRVIETASRAPERHLARLPLASLHRQLGARFGAWAGQQVVAGYGELGREAEALSSGAGLYDRSWIGRLELTGKDRQRFLHGLVSCDVKALEPGEGAYGFFTSQQGKILADVTVLSLPDRLWLALPAGQGEGISAHLKKFLIADRVEVLPLADMLPLTLLGPQAEATLTHLAELPAPPRGNLRAMVLGIEVAIERSALAGQPGFTLWVSASVAPPLVEELLALPGVLAVGRDAVEQVRVEAGVPAFGQDFGSDHFPQESGLEAQAVSYTKGCYLGQEVIARIHYRGKANRGVRRLLFDRTGAPPAGTRLLFEEQEVGAVGSAVVPLAGGNAVGIAVLHRKAYEPGMVLAVEGYGSAEVSLLPE